MHTLKNILKRYAAWIAKVLAPLGPWGVFAIAAVDGSLFGMPVDAVVAGYVYHDRSRFLLYVLLASAGSAMGSLVIYGIGYFGGETVLRKRIPPERFAKIHASFERHEFWALMFPAMLPPPTPFKMFVLAASAFEMRLTHFLAAVFAGRFVRFLVLALLTIQLWTTVRSIRCGFAPSTLWLGLVGGDFGVGDPVARRVEKKQTEDGGKAKRCERYRSRKAGLTLIRVDHCSGTFFVGQTIGLPFKKLQAEILGRGRVVPGLLGRTRKSRVKARESRTSHT